MTYNKLMAGKIAQQPVPGCGTVAPLPKLPALLSGKFGNRRDDG
jgi:hypothetical protein